MFYLEPPVVLNIILTWCNGIFQNLSYCPLCNLGKKMGGYQHSTHV
jgi:hypothetical protein